MAAVTGESSRDRRSRRRKTERLLRTKQTLEVILSHVRNGGSLIGLCETWDVRYSDILAWVRAEPARSKAYDQAVADRSEWTDEMVLNEIRQACRFDIRQLYNLDGTLKGIHELDPETARMVQTVEVDELFTGHGDQRRRVGESKKVKVYDRLKALEMTAKSRRLLVDKTELEGSVKLEDLIGASMPAESPAAAQPPAA